MPEDFIAKEDELLRRLAEKLKADPQFSDADYKALRGLIQAYEGWRIFGRGAKWVIYVLAAIAGGMTAWNTIVAQARAWWGG